MRPSKVTFARSHLRQQPRERLGAALHPLYGLLHDLEQAVGGEGIEQHDSGEVTAGYLGLDIEVVLGQEVGAALAVALLPRVDVADGQVCERVKGWSRRRAINVILGGDKVYDEGKRIYSPSPSFTALTVLTSLYPLSSVGENFMQLGDSEWLKMEK